MCAKGSLALFPILPVAPTFLFSPAGALDTQSVPAKHAILYVLSGLREKKTVNCIGRKGVGRWTSTAGVREDSPLGVCPGRWVQSSGNHQICFHCSFVLSEALPYLSGGEGELPPRIGCVTLGKSPHFSELGFPPLETQGQ